METNVGTNQDYELWALLNQTSYAIYRAIEKELKQFDIPMMHAEVLFVVKNAEGPVTPAEISRWLFREPHTVSGLLNRMEKQGLVRRVKDLERKNLIRVVITEKGEEAYHRSRDLKSIRNILSCLSLKERDNLRAYLKTLRSKALEELRVERQLPFP